LLGLPVRLRAQAKAAQAAGSSARRSRGHSREWLTGVTLVPMPNVLGDLGPIPSGRSPQSLSGACIPRDLNPHVSEGGLEPFAYVIATGADPWLSV
jgi:hypothetical protein